MHTKTSVHYWKFHNGVDPFIPGNPFEEVIPLRGWTCWVYPEDDRKFEEWMLRMCPTAEVTHRFNSGDPMYSVSILDDTEATVFRLMWL